MFVKPAVKLSHMRRRSGAVITLVRKKTDDSCQKHQVPSVRLLRKKLGHLAGSFFFFFFGGWIEPGRGGVCVGRGVAGGVSMRVFEGGGGGVRTGESVSARVLCFSVCDNFALYD